MSKEDIKENFCLIQEERYLMRERVHSIVKQGLKIRDPDRFDLLGELILE